VQEKAKLERKSTLIISNQYKRIRTKINFIISAVLPQVMTFHNNRDIIDDFWFLINFGLMPYSFVLGQILALSLVQTDEVPNKFPQKSEALYLREYYF